MAEKPKVLKPVKPPVAKLAVKKAVPAAKAAAVVSLTAKANGPKAAQSMVDASSMAVSSPAAEPSSVLKMKDLLDKVVAASGAKKADARGIIEATLAALGDALSNGDTLILPPLGRAKVSRAAEAGSGKAMTIKLRRSTATGAGGAKAKQFLADEED